MVTVTGGAFMVTVTAFPAPPAVSVIVTRCVITSAIGVIVTVGAFPLPKTVLVTKDSCVLIVH